MRRSWIVVAAALAIAESAPSPRARAAGAVRVVNVATDDPVAPAVGSFRKAIADAAPGDVVRFESPIDVDLVAPIDVPSELVGLRIEGPGGLRWRPPKRASSIGAFDVKAAGVTIDHVTFRNLRVDVASAPAVGDVLPVAGFAATSCTFLENGGVRFDTVHDGVVDGCTFDVGNARAGTAAVEMNASLRCRVTHNKIAALKLPQGGFAVADVNGRELAVEDNEELKAGVFLQTISASVRRNKIVGARLDVLPPDGNFAAGHVDVTDNEAAYLRVSRVNVDVLDNTVVAGDRRLASKLPGKKEEAALQSYTALRVVAADPRGGAAPVRVLRNTVSGAMFGMAFVDLHGQGDGSEFEDNVITGAAGTGLYVQTAAPLALRRNHVVNAGTKHHGIGIELRAGAGVLTLSDNEVLGTSGVGMVVQPNGVTVNLDHNRVANSTRTGIVAGKRELISVADVVENNGKDGLLLNRGSRTRIDGTTLRGNGGAGVYVDAGVVAEVRRVVSTANAGPGIDLAPKGVTPNAKKSKANNDVGFPENLVFEEGTRTVRGKASPAATIDAYGIEEGARAGNPKNGEGAVYLGSTQADGQGNFVWQAGPCPPSGLLTFTATDPGGVDHAVTSEFSADLACVEGVAVELVSQSPAGAAGDDISSVGSYQSFFEGGTACVGAGGRFVAFTSTAVNLTADAGDPHDFHVYLRDTVAGTTLRLSNPIGGAFEEDFHRFNQVAGDSASVSDDGQFVAFRTGSRKVIPGEVDPPMPPDIQGDGPSIALWSASSGANTAVTDPSYYEPALPSGLHTHLGGDEPSISGDGSAVAFVSYGRDWDGVEADFNRDVFVWTRTTGAVERASVRAGAPEVQDNPSNPLFMSPRLSRDARFVVFTSLQNLTPGNTTAGPKAFLRDLQTDTTAIVSVDGTGAARTGSTPVVSDDGRFVAFVSAEKLLPSDTNALDDVYLLDRQNGALTHLSLHADGTPFVRYCRSPTISGDGRFVAFVHNGEYHVPGGFTGVMMDDVWLVDRQKGTVEEISGGPDGEAFGTTNAPALSRDGTAIVFQSIAWNLVPQVTDVSNQVRHVFLRRLGAR